MELAWQFGCPVEELQGRMSSYEFSWWKAFAVLRAKEADQMKAKAQARSGRGSTAKTMGQR